MAPEGKRGQPAGREAASLGPPGMCIIGFRAQDKTHWGGPAHLSPRHTQTSVMLNEETRPQGSVPAPGSTWQCLFQDTLKDIPGTRSERADVAAHSYTICGPRGLGMVLPHTGPSTNVH